MAAVRIDGFQMAAEIRAEIAAETARRRTSGHSIPGLAAVLVGNNPAGEVYVRNKRRACDEVGFQSWLHRIPGDGRPEELFELIDSLNADRAVSGILVQLPLPKQFDESRVIRAIHPTKDVDAFHPENLGLLAAGHPRYLPCTPAGVREMLRRADIPTAGRNVVVLGRSNIVGKPTALILMQKPSSTFPEAGDATVTVVHRGTRGLAEICRSAEILVAAIGVPRFVTAEMVRPGAAVIDVGINSVEGKIVGDVDAERVAEVAGALSPVPRGVGPMTIAMLLQNTLKAATISTPSAS